MNLKTTITSILILTAPAFVMAGGTHNDGHDAADEHGDGHKMEHMSSIGGPAEYSPENRQIEVILDDSMRFTFSPELESLKAGEAVSFIVRNDGKINHEFTIGTAEEQKSHMEMMKKMPEMKHNDESSMSLAPGAEGEMNWRFAGNEEVVFSCNIPGHYEAGMHHEAMIVGEATSTQ